MDSASGSRQDWAVIARLGKTRGLKGESATARVAGRRAQYAVLPEVSAPPGRTGGLAVVGDQFKPVSVVLAYKGGLIFRFEGIEPLKPPSRCKDWKSLFQKKNDPRLAKTRFTWPT